MPKKKPINTFKQRKDNTEVEFTDDERSLVEIVTQHINNSACINGNWTFAIFGYDNFKVLKTFNKPCLKIIYVELLFARPMIEVLTKDLKFLEDTTFRPEILNYMGAIVIYCESEGV